MATAEIIAPGSALALLPNYKPAELFAPGFIDPLIDRIKAEVRAVPTDISTSKGREAVAALAYKVGRSKTFIDAQRLALVADEKKRLKAIDVEGARVWDELEALQKEVRKPLTDWENADKERVAAHEQALASIPESSMYGALESSQDVKRRLEYLSTAYASRDWQEFYSRAKAAFEIETVRTQGILASVEKREHDAAELARLRAESIERERVEREAEIARKATERAEAAERTRRDQAARDAEAERQRIENEKFQAEARAKQAEAQRVADAETAEKARVAAEQRAQAAQEAAVKAERERIAQEHEDARNVATARENNKRHVSKINGEVSLALIEHGTSEDVALAVVKALAANLIPHVRISY